MTAVAPHYTDLIKSYIINTFTGSVNRMNKKKQIQSGNNNEYTIISTCSYFNIGNLIN